MIYISSSSSKKTNIIECIEEIYQHGYTNIELSGGTKYYEGIESDLLDIQQRLSINLLLHNYFPPPKNAFILNLASLNEEIFEQSMTHCKRAIDLSIQLGCTKYAVHAGFFIDIQLQEVGKKLTREKLFDIPTATRKFCNAYNELKTYTKGKLTLYLENNVISNDNYQTFNQVNPFLLTDFNSFMELQDHLDFDILLDLAHLKVSCNTLDYIFGDHLEKLITTTNYIHISDNDGLSDGNKGIVKDSDLLQAIGRHDITDKTITLEIYESFNNIKNSYNSIQFLIDGK